MLVTSENNEVLLSFDSHERFIFNNWQVYRKMETYISATIRCGQLFLHVVSGQPHFISSGMLGQLEILNRLVSWTEGIN
jgi:hypothetical protein